MDLTGDELAAWRKQHGLSQTELADLLGVQRNTVTRWETGKRRPLPGKVLDLAIEALEQRQPAARRAATEDEG